MEIVINIDDEEPLFSQLIGQIKKAVLNDTIEPGSALPSIRQLANDLGINNKTVAKAYGLLERDEVIETKGYRGTFVHVNAKANCAVDMNAWVKEQLDKRISAFRSKGITDSEIRIAFADAMNKHKN